MTSARSVCMTVSRASGAGLCGVGSITLSGGKGSACIVFAQRKCTRLSVVNDVDD